MLGNHSGHHGITILSGTNNGGYIMFSDNNGGGSNAYRGQIEYQHNGDYMRFLTATFERLRITSAGAWGIAGANYGTDGQVLTSGGSGAAVAWEDAAGGMFSRAWYDGDATETTITGGSGDTRVGGNSGANLNITFTPPSTSTRYFYLVYLHVRFSGGGQWGWRPQFTTNNGTSWTGIGNHPSFSHEHPNAVFREGFVQMRTFHPNTTNECKFGLWAQVWPSHSGSITLNGSNQNSRMFLFEIADNSNFYGI